LIPDLRHIIADIVDVKPEQIDDAFGPATTDRWDSMNHLRIVTAVEDEYGIRFTMDEISSIDSYERLQRLVTEKRG
jgi:acyl carrier protein